MQPDLPETGGVRVYKRWSLPPRVLTIPGLHLFGNTDRFPL